MSEQQFDKFVETLDRLRVFEFHHGDCVGSDETAHQWIMESYQDPASILVVHPPDNPELRAFCQGGTILRPKPRLPRNRDIVEACSILIATPRPWSRGTRYTIEYAQRMKRATVVIEGDGSAVWTDGTHWEPGEP